MSQHDYSLANANGASFRADANNAIAAIVSNNSGASEPSTMFAYMLWADTTSGLMKQRNAANSAWVTIGTMATTGLGLIFEINGITTETAIDQTNDYVPIYDSSATAHRKISPKNLLTVASTSFTPTARGTGTSGSGTYTTQTGKYIQIGNIVFFTIGLGWTAHTGTGNLRFASLPVTAAAGQNYAVKIRCDNFTYGTNKELVGLVLGSSTEIQVEAQETGLSSSEIAIDASVGTFQISGFYFV
jgi:hypothetical protein